MAHFQPSGAAGIMSPDHLGLQRGQSGQMSQDIIRHPAR